MHELDEPVFQTTDQNIIGWRNNNRLCFAINYFSYLSFFYLNLTIMLRSL